MRLVLKQMAHFWFNSRCDAEESGQNRRLRPQKPPLEQIRASASSTGAGSRAVREECGHVSTPFTPNASATNCRQRRLLELVFIRKSTLIFSPPSSFLPAAPSHCLFKLQDSRHFIPDLRDLFHGAHSQISEGFRFSWARIPICIWMFVCSVSLFLL